jgi:glycerol uptake facilitator-like aquaporin
MFGRRKIATLVAEFLGTGFLTLLVLSVQRSTIGVSFFVAAAAGLTFAVMYFAFGNLSGGHFNPALTIGMWTTRKVTTARMIVYVIAQLLGGYGAYLLYRYYSKSALQPIGGEFSWRIFVAEAVGAGLFAISYAAAAYQGLSTAVRATTAGIGYMVGMVAASAVAIGLINPAVALGVRAWVWGTYILGPIVGAVIGVNLYHYLFDGLTEPALVPVAASTSVSTSSTGEKVQTTTVVARKPRKAAASKTTAARKTSKSTTRKPAAKRAPRAR